jgi:hypothetical protein
MSVRDCVQCSASTRNGQQCSKMTCLYSEFCAIHTKSLFDLQIKRSGIAGSGKGLFTTKQIKKGAKIARYTGTLMSNEEYAEAVSGYGLGVSHGRVIDAKSTQSSLGRNANSCLKQNKNDGECPGNNAKFSIHNKGSIPTAWIKATKNIPAGNEIFIAYGRKYWTKGRKKPPNPSRNAEFDASIDCERRKSSKQPSYSKAELVEIATNTIGGKGYKSMTKQALCELLTNYSDIARLYDARLVVADDAVVDIRPVAVAPAWSWASTSSTSVSASKPKPPLTTLQKLMLSIGSPSSPSPSSPSHSPSPSPSPSSSSPSHSPSPSSSSSHSSYKNMLAKFKKFIATYRNLPWQTHQAANPFRNERLAGRMIEKLANRTGVLSSMEINDMLDKVLKAVKKDSKHMLYKIYKDMTVQLLSKRLLSKRPLVYFGTTNSYLLPGKGEQVDHGESDYIAATQSMRQQYLHPDEAILSSFLGMMLPSVAINDGNRKNRGKTDKFHRLEPCTVYVAAQVGVRLESTDTTDYRSIFGKPANMFERFIRKMLNEKSGKSKPTNRHRYTAKTNMIMAALIENTIQVSKLEGKKVILQITGLGLGEWAGTNKKERTDDFITGLVEVLDEYTEDINKVVHRIEMLWFETTAKQRKKLSQYNIILSKTAPFSKEKLKEGKPIVSSFAWDGMSYLGNEYFLGKEYFAASGDPAMACSTSISYLGNPQINEQAFERPF